ncbi:MAG: long-chain-fatty-acid--CoA ligase [Elusimicrobiota bacterium]|jgi:long-chain acyl-CoA synthetase|nr:long-chain-fatty-acid--CoA ligase [Elusimicrobiota bacterium]
MGIKLTDIYHTLTASAYKRPEATALVFGGANWSYHQLLMNVDRAADMFWQHGIRKGDKVAVALKNSPEVVITNYALFKIGAVAVPVNFMISKPQELQFILADCLVKAVVTQAEYLKNYAAVKKDLPALKYIFSTDEISSSVAALKDETIKLFWPAVNAGSFNAEILSSKTNPEDMAMLLYTSGTTGNPKGVVLTHYNILFDAQSCVLSFKITEEDAFICILPLFHTFAWTTSMVLPLALGLKIVLIANITPASAWLNLMGKERVSLMVAVPQLYSVLSKEAKGLKRLYLQYWAFRKMRLAISGAAPLSKETMDHFEQRLDIPLLEGYGLTETSPVVSVNTETARKKGSVGINLPYIKVKIADDNGNELPRNVEGEICIKGENVTQGYYNNTQATMEAFDRDGWFKTGDIGVIDEEGFIFIRDRKKDMIIIKGLKVFSAQVEHVINEYPGVEECAVIGVPDGHGNEFIKLYAVKKKGADFNEADFRKFLKTKLDNYKRPRDIEFLEELPKNALRKVLKKDLRKEAAEKYQARLKAGAAEVAAEL